MGGSQWVVKVDPATVFMPNKPAAHLAITNVPTDGTYFENCKGVDSGFFGNLELVSTKAFQTFLDKLEDCKLNLCWDGKPDCENWQYGPWGEDKFMQECLDRQSIRSGTPPRGSHASGRSSRRTSRNEGVLARLGQQLDESLHSVCIGSGSSSFEYLYSVCIEFSRVRAHLTSGCSAGSPSARAAAR